MPIKPENKHRYPKNWRDIRARILKRAQNRCEWCGVKNYAIGQWDGDTFFVHEGMEIESAVIDGERLVKIVLTIMHLDHTPENCDEKNLKAACQKCHNRYDIKHRVKNRRKDGTLEMELL